jgi:hypothetical protein
LAASGFAAGRRFFRAGRRDDNGGGAPYIRRVRKLLVIVPLLALLALALWFAITAWVRLGGGDPIPLYGYIAIAGGILFSLLIGGGLMALVFYSSRHGYDDGQGDGQ